ncbi:alpha/beta fold hydrolase [Deinococcus yavapaiensis]|uniref:Pimeloyl-ACP methyl ester carboxylesterase n=1 Tax=Deinococcus yavapaiensis KR-236 TaxID=694435 RepID=A0A318S9L7_9DEIO|nr:alpha/beta fold hydrolase [Deinococcus yavapaiensis]PYE54760.1 pimeloyl-ACP methyl ester carboxylesterase [Deinococcus yavapaiensis KR-236]
MADSAAPLVVLHGALQSRAALAPLLAVLEGRADAIDLTLAGHGGRDIPDELTTSGLARDVLEQLDAASVRNAHFYGYSLGGYVALYLARHFPDRVRSVFAHATKLAWTPDVAEREAASLDPDALTARAPKFAAALERTHAPRDWRVLSAKFAALMRRLGEQPDLTHEDFGAMSCPVLFAVGDRDALVSIAETIDAYRAVSAGRLSVMPGVPHALSASLAPRVAFELEQFLREVS